MVEPELWVYVKNEKLYIHYGNGRYGYWKYTFKFRNSTFELIGYDSIDSDGPVINNETSINFLTKKKLERVNINQNTKSDEEKFEEKRKDIEVNKLIQLSEIKDFDDLDLKSKF
jgi:hypothetical protein